MGGLEFYVFGDELWCKSTDGKNVLVDETQTEIIKAVFYEIRECYPLAYKALSKEYEKSSLNTSYFQYLIVRRFCKCNFGKLDTAEDDVADTGMFRFEKVECPLRGECRFEGVICSPKFNTKLSDAELRVMNLIYQGLCRDEIAEQLYISPHTVKNHIKSVYLKLGIHEKSEFIRYANEHNLFNI
jgi:hypothetical protein